MLHFVPPFVSTHLPARKTRLGRAIACFEHFMMCVMVRFPSIETHLVDSPGPRFDGRILERSIGRGQTQIELLSVNSMEMT